MGYFNEFLTEHEQDGFIAWMCDNFNNSANPDLQKMSKKFIDFLITPCGGTPFVSSYQLVKVERQKYKIDVLITLKTNDENYYIIIEDKIDSEEHGKQLQKYVSELKNNKVVLANIFVVYFKTGHIIKSGKELLYNKQQTFWEKSFTHGEHNRVTKDLSVLSVKFNIIDLPRIDFFFFINRQLISKCNNFIINDYVHYIEGRFNQIKFHCISSQSPAFVWIKTFDDFVCGFKSNNPLGKQLIFAVAPFTANDPELQITLDNSQNGCVYPVMCIHSKDLCSNKPYIRFQNKKGSINTAIMFVYPIPSKTSDKIMNYKFQYGHFSNNKLNSICNPKYTAITVNELHSLLTEICKSYCDVINGQAKYFSL